MRAPLPIIGLYVPLGLSAKDFRVELRGAPVTPVETAFFAGLVTGFIVAGLFAIVVAVRVERRILSGEIDRSEEVQR